MRATIILTFNNLTWRQILVSLASHIDKQAKYEEISILHLVSLDVLGEDYLRDKISRELTSHCEANGWNYVPLDLGKFRWRDLLKHRSAKNLTEQERHSAVQQIRGSASIASGSLGILESYVLAHYSHCKQGLQLVNNWFETTNRKDLDLFISNGKDPLIPYLLDSLGFVPKTIWYYEDLSVWTTEDQLYLGKFKAHDREGHQALAMSATINRDESLAKAKSWLDARVSKSSGTPLNSCHYRQNAFFDTSTFEYQYLPSSWNTKPFEDQYEGFEFALSKFDPAGSNSTLRVHPNLRSGSTRSQLQTVRRILKVRKKHPNLKVIWHFETFDSYALLMSSQRVFFSSSTIGLEAVIADKNVIRVGTSFFDTIIGIPHLLDRDNDLRSPENVGLLAKYVEDHGFPRLPFDTQVYDQKKYLRSRWKPVELFQVIWYSRKKISSPSGRIMSRFLVWVANLPKLGQ